jgi:carboxyl-terminal processing protease
MRYYTPSGRSIQAEGIQPDIAVESKRVSDDPIRVTRERDLEGHLPAEGRPAARGTRVFREPGSAHPDGTPETSAGPRTAAEVPMNPVGGSDFALSIAYQLVRGVLVTKN